KDSPIGGEFRPFPSEIHSFHPLLRKIKEMCIFNLHHFH
ncbi:hypothetical protein PRIPAC_76388, partial [Pristionchus pacificus]